MHYLTQRRGWYYYRQAIPRALQASWGRSEVCHPLQTQNPIEAKIRAYKLASQLLEHFREMEQVKQLNEPTLEEVLAKSQEARKFETETNPITGRLSIKRAEPGEDFSNALSYVNSENQKLEDIGVIGRDCFLPQKPAPTITEEKVKEIVKETKEEAKNLAGVAVKNLHGAFNAYLSDKKKLKSLRHYKEAIKGFIDWITAQHPNIAVHKIRKDHLRDYKTYLSAKPNDKRKKELLDDNTIWKKLSFIRSFFIYCQKNDWLAQGDRNIPTYGVIGDRPDPLMNENSYVRFGSEELKKIFNTENYKAKFLKFDEKRPHLFWFPIVGAFTGARSAEVADIDLNLVENNNPEGVWLMTIHGDVKTASSNNRTIPIPQKLIDLGFLEYITDLKKIFPKTKKLFPYSDDVDGEQFINYITDLGIKTDSKKVFHSFRKNISHFLMVGNCPDKFSKYYTGHLNASLHKNIYEGFDHPLIKFKAYLDASITYPIDVEALKYQSGMFNDYLERKSRRK